MDKQTLEEDKKLLGNWPKALKIILHDYRDGYGVPEVYIEDLLAAQERVVRSETTQAIAANIRKSKLGLCCTQGQGLNCNDLIYQKILINPTK